MSLTRRSIIKGVATALSAIALLPSTLLAAWPKNAFVATTRDEVVKVLFNDALIEPSDKIHIKLDKRAESGDNIPIEVTTTLTNVQSISLLLNNNPHPLAANIRFTEQAVPFLATRLRLNGSSEVTAIVQTADALYSRQHNIRVLVGGCHQ